MKRLSFFAMFIAMVLSASAQYHMHLWIDGVKISYPVLNLDSITFTDEAIEEPEEPTEPFVGVFSVSPTKYVTFSPGNLQYHPANDEWRFAEHQWDYVGEANSNIAADYAGWLDLFGWGTGDTPTESISDYRGYLTFMDWGKNKIGNDTPNTWRTLSKDEWEYLRWERPNYSELCGVAQVNGVNGLIFLPDNWTCPESIIFKSGFHSEPDGDYYAQYQTFTVEQWSQLETSGAVFLPATGYRFILQIYFVQSSGAYWSNTEYDESSAYYTFFSDNEAGMYKHERDCGLSVRLVKDVEGENIDPEQPGEGGEEPGEPDPGTPDTPEGPTPVVGVFSVAEGKTVTFSPGNLQYHPANNVWQFAANQTDYIGDANSTISSTYNGWIDLFGWSTSATNFGVSTSTDENDYSGSFVDWGTNTIGNDAPNTWRTLSHYEWNYLLWNRTNANDLYGVAQVNGVNGLILLPDNWTCPAGVTFKSGFHSVWGVNYYALYQTFTADQWSKLEKSGAIFLPAVGYRVGTNVDYVQNLGLYWSATVHSSYYARFISFSSDGASVAGIGRYHGQSVRLVKDVEDETIEPETPSVGIVSFSVSASKQVTFSPGNLQYHPTNDEWRFAKNQWNYVGEANSNIAADHDGWLDLFGWGTGDCPTKASEDNTDYPTFVDWGTNKIGNDAPNTWRTLTNKEWDYLRNSRPNAHSLCGVAQVNGVNGLILLPDNWTCPAGVTFKYGFHSDYSVEAYGQYQTFTAEQWSKLEKSGAVFLPAAGYRYGSDVDGVQGSGGYWSATAEYDSNRAYCLDFYSYGAYVPSDLRYNGLSVRLVKDVEGETTEPETPEEDEEPETPSIGIVSFSVSASKQVTFSPGNLQYTQSTNTWSFASTQWEMLGTDNVTGGSVDPTYGDIKHGDALADKIDLFGWSTSTTNFGVSTSLDWDDYNGSFVDWGANKIGNDAPNTWRTLTTDEWYYLLYSRTNADDLCGVAQVNGVNGLILLPDNWICPAGVTFKYGFHSSDGVEYYAAYQTFTADQWSKLEKSGAVFLPAAGARYGSDVNSGQYDGYYWSATEHNSYYAVFLDFGSGEAGMDYYYRYRCQSVRLVKDVEGETTEPETPEEDEEPETPTAGIGSFSVSASKQVTFSKGNLQYTQSTDTWSFASAQWEMLGTHNVTGGNVTSDKSGYFKSGTALADKIDLFGWGTGNAPTKSIDSYTYYPTFVDWGTNKIGNDAPNTWRTLTYDEWHYLRWERPNYSGLYGVAQVNGVNGLIFLPDNWTCPEGVTFKSGFHSDSSVEAYGQYQTFTAEQWSTLEKSGAVFLPAAGARYGSDVSDVRYNGFYWSATERGHDNARYLSFSSDEARMYDYGYRYYGHSVRLVKDL